MQSFADRVFTKADEEDQIGWVRNGCAHLYKMGGHIYIEWVWTWLFFGG